MVFPVVMYGCESWTIKKAEHRRIDASELWCWRRLLRVPWTERSTSPFWRNRSWVFFGRNDAKAEAPVLWPPHAKSWPIGKDSDAGRDRGQKGERDYLGWDGWMASRTRWKWVWVNSGSWWWTQRPGVLRFMALQRVGHGWATELKWTELMQLPVQSALISIFVAYIKFELFGKIYRCIAYCHKIYDSKEIRKCLQNS